MAQGTSTSSRQCIWSALFEERGFVCFDVLRDEIWDMEYVEIWYRQNILIFANDIGAKWLKENGLTPKKKLDS